MIGKVAHSVKDRPGRFGPSTDLDPHVGWPRHVALGLGQARALYPGAQTFAAVQGSRMRHHLPLEFVVSEAIAHLDLHGQH